MSGLFYLQSTMIMMMQNCRANVLQQKGKVKKKHYIFQSGKIEADAPIITLFSVSPFFVSQGDRGPHNVLAMIINFTYGKLNKSYRYLLVLKWKLRKFSLMKWKFCIEDIGNEMETVENYWWWFLRWPTVASDALDNSSKVWISPMLYNFHKA